MNIPSAKDFPEPVSPGNMKWGSLLSSTIISNPFSSFPKYTWLWLHLTGV